jgi:hypothetical protein
MSALFRAADGTFAPKDLEPAKVDLEPNATMEMNFDVLKVNCIVPVSALLLVQIGDNTLTADFTIKPAVAKGCGPDCPSPFWKLLAIGGPLVSALAMALVTGFCRAPVRKGTRRPLRPDTGLYPVPLTL